MEIDTHELGPLETPHLSVLIPVYNEEDNIEPLVERVFGILEALPHTFEVIAVDDGSRDQSFARLQDAASRHPQLRVIRFRRNYGQTAAMMAGIDAARGDVFVTLDADLQNDPADIPALLAKLDEGFDVVSGWRKSRQDARFRRVFTSRVASRLISAISGVHLSDFGCTLKAYRRDVIKDVKLYGEMHRFIPLYANWRGAQVTEIAVRHHPRMRGQSKYGLERIVKVVLDLLVVGFLGRYFVKPIYVFGSVGLLSIGAGVLSVLAMVWLRLADGIGLLSTPLPAVAAVFVSTGATGILLGLLAEIAVRTHFEAQGRPAYVVRETVNF